MVIDVWWTVKCQLISAVEQRGRARAERNWDYPATSTKTHFEAQISTYTLRNLINIDAPIMTSRSL